MSKYIIKIATETDDSELKRLLSQYSMGSRIQITFQREPSYFQAAQIGNKLNQVVIIRDKVDNSIVAFASRSSKLMYINGKVEEIGYLSNLRIDQTHRNGTLLYRGFKYLKKLHQDKRVPMYVETIVEGNTCAMNVLTSKRLELPVHFDCGNFYSIAVNLLGKKGNLKNNIRIERGSIERLNDIIECLHRNGAKKQFYSYYTKEDFLSGNGFLKDFRIDDFYIALKDDKVVGILGKWDQLNSKQIVVTKYRRGMRAIMPFINMGAKIFKFSPLPRENEELNCFYISFIAIDSNDIDIFRTLLRAVYNDSIGKKYHHALIGLHEKDPLLKAVREYNHFEYKSKVFIVCWEDGNRFYREIDNRIPYLEIATL